MRDHNEIRRMLAALAGNDLSLADRALVEQHLADCPSCRAELSQLQAVVQAVRTTPDLAPPPWLATRIMARVREEASPQRNWLARLFLPLHIKLPLEALALIMVCISAWYVMQDVERSQQVKSDLPQVSSPVEEPARDATVQSTPQASVKSSTVAPVLPKTESSQPRQTVHSVAPAAQEQATAPAFVPPLQQTVADRTEPMERVKSAPGAAPAAPAVSREQATGSSAPMAERKMESKRKAENSDTRLDAAASPQLRLSMVVHDREAFAGKLAVLLQRLGGSVITSRPGIALVRIEVSRMAEMIEQLGRFGSVTERPSGELPRYGWIELTIFWQVM